ncbi:MAG: sodium:proton antiporter [Micavibrio sp.]|nr:sodium:proton antiporter [Micavibrio sp.]
MEDILTQISWIAFFTIIAQLLGWWMKIPAIVPLLIGGLIAGPVFGLVDPSGLLGDDLLRQIISVSVGIILFEGSLNLNFKEIKEAKASIRSIILIGGPFAWVITAWAGHWIAGLSWPVALTFGALLIVTGPTVIIPLLRNARLKEKPASMLKWEGIINDPIGAVLAILCYEFFRLSQEAGHMAGFVSTTILSIIVIIFMGIFFAYVIAKMFNREMVPEYLKPTFLLGAVVIFFTLCNSIEHDFGLIGVTILGVAMANMGVTGIEEIKRFKETLSILLVSSVFILITANIDPSILLGIGWRGLAFVFCILFVVRPLTILISNFRSKLTWQEILLTGWIAPRGIVCAAVAGVLGPEMYAIGYEDGGQIFALAFAVVLATVFLHGLSAKPLAKKLGLAHPEGDSLIIVGSSDWAIEFAQVLKSRNFNVIVADKNWHALKAARLSDLATYYGELLSEETEFHLELARYNMLLAVTNNPAYNALICSKFVHEFGRDRVYQFSPHEEDEHQRRKMSDDVRGQTFGPTDADYWDVASAVIQDWRFRSVRVANDENMQKLLDKRKAGTLQIFGYITPKNKLFLSPPEDLDKLDAGHILIVLEEKQAEAVDSQKPKQILEAQKAEDLQIKN